MPNPERPFWKEFESESGTLDSDKFRTLSSLLRDSSCMSRVLTIRDSDPINETDIDPSDISSRITLGLIRSPLEPLGKVILNKTLLEKAINCEYLNPLGKKSIFFSLGIIGNSFGFFNSEHGKLIRKRVDDPLRKDIQDFLTFGEEAVHQNLFKLEKIIRQDNNPSSPIAEDTKNIFNSINSVIKITENVRIKKDCVNFVLKNFEDVIRSKENYFAKAKEDEIKSMLFSIDLLEMLTSLRNITQLEAGKQMLIRMLKDKNDNISIIVFTELSRYWRRHPESKTIREMLLQDISVEKSNILFDYDANLFQDLGLGIETEFRVRNIRSIYRLESKRPGIAKALFEKFGIIHFLRYPEEILIDQYDESIRENRGKKNDKESSYGLIINPQEDYSGVFADEKEMYKNFYNQLERYKYRLRIFEVSRTKGLINALFKSYRDWGKISFAILGGHGGDNGLKLGEEGPRRYISKEYLKSRGMQVVRSVFTKNPVIILNSCLAGTLGDIGQEMSKSNAKTIGTDSVMNVIKEIAVKFSNDNSLDFSVNYADEDGKAIGANVFQNGDCIKENLQTISFFP
jgi:hypothetical protein